MILSRSLVTCVAPSAFSQSLSNSRILQANHLRMASQLSSRFNAFILAIHVQANGRTGAQGMKSKELGVKELGLEGSGLQYLPFLDPRG